METATSFGPWLKQRRKALDLTQAELAARRGLRDDDDPEDRGRGAPALQAAGRAPGRRAGDRGRPAADLRYLGTRSRGARTGGAHVRPARPDAADDRRVHNLPLEQTSFVGRERELAAARLLLMAIGS